MLNARTQTGSLAVNCTCRGAPESAPDAAPVEESIPGRFAGPEVAAGVGAGATAGGAQDEVSGVARLAEFAAGSRGCVTAGAWFDAADGSPARAAGCCVRCHHT